MEKNSERVLNHAMEIICLLTGEVSLLQHLTKSHIKIKSSKDKKMTEKILNHTMGIIYLLTGEEYAIVKRNPPQSSHHQRIKECEDSAVSLSMEVWEQTGHKEAHNKLEVSSHKSQGLQDENVDTEKEEDEIDEKDILQVTIHSDPCTDLQDEDLSNVSINEDGEYDRDEKDIVQMEIHSDPCTGSVEVKPSVIPKSEQEEELDERGHLHVKEEEIPIKIGEGLLQKSVCLTPSSDTGVTVLSKRGREKFASDGFLYIFERLSEADKDIKFWRCDQLGRCKARIHTRNGEVVKKINEHSHFPSAANVEVAKFLTGIKRRADETVEGTSEVINSCMANVSPAIHAVIPKYEALRKTIQRRRNELQVAAPSDPLRLDDLVLPEEYKTYSPTPDVQESFLIGDFGEGSKRIIIFGRNSWLQILQSSDTWYVDGTFSTAPRLFAQVYVILAKKYGGLHPMLYALLPDKQPDTYKRLFAFIKTVLPNIKPKSIYSNYEMEAINAIRDGFPGTAVNGCFFHLVQNMRKHLADIGVVQEFDRNTEFALRAKMVVALAFVPIPDLGEYVATLEEYLPEALLPLLNWFEDNYIGHPGRRGQGRQSPLFPPPIWNVFNRTLKGDDQTNNYAEAAHRPLHAELGICHTTIWKFIDGLRKVQKGRDAYYEQLVSGHSPLVKLKKYHKADERISKIVTDYGNKTCIEYLRDIANNYPIV